MYLADNFFFFFTAGPLPMFDGINMTAPASRQDRVPILKQDKVAEYASIFERTGAQNGLLQGKRYHKKAYQSLRH